MKKRVFSAVIAFLIVIVTSFGYLPAKEVSAKVVVPQIEFANPPVTQYYVGDRVNFNIHSPNYGGRVQYRVVLWNDSKKTYYDLWNSGNGYPERYYTKWQPFGNNIFTLGWIIFEPGSYRITVYAKRAGIPNSKTALRSYNCDSYMQSVAFTVKTKEPVVESILPLDDVTVNQGETPILPNYVKAATDDGFIKELRVTWPSVSTTIPGTYTVEGTVDGTNKKATIKVKVIGQTAFGVASVNSTNNTTVNINLREPVYYTPNASVFTIKEFNTNTNLPVYLANLSADKKTITLSTAYMTSNSWYTLTVSNNSYNFVANQGNSYGISIAAQNKQVAVGETTFATVSKYPSDVALSYSSNNTSVATVDSYSGLITGKAPGIATITVNGSKYGYTTATTTFIVTVGSQNGMYAYAQDIEVNVGEEKLPYVSKNPSDLTLHFTSNNTSIATVDYYSGKVKGVTAGTTTITIAASKYGYSTFYSTFKVTVKGQNVSIVAIPSISYEAPINDGSIEQKPIELYLAGSTYVNWGYFGYYRNYIHIENLPYGLDFNVEYAGTNTLKLYLTGKAHYHRNIDDTNIRVVLAKELVTGATADVVSNNIFIDFTDVGAPAAPTNPVVDDIRDTFGWTNVPGYNSISDYEYSVDNGVNYVNCTGNPQVVGNNSYAAGTVKVRVKAATGRSAGVPLASDKAFTKVSDLEKPILRAMTITFKDETGYYNLSPNSSGNYYIPSFMKGKEIKSLKIKVEDNNLNTSPVSIIDEETGTRWGTLMHTEAGEWILNPSSCTAPVFNKAGTLLLSATFTDSSNAVKAYFNINVVEIVKIDNVGDRVEKGKTYVMPTKVRATMSDNTTRDFGVVWNPDFIDTTEVGIKEALGTVAGYNAKVKLTVEVYSNATIVSIANQEKTIKVGETFKLPSQVAAQMSDGSTKLVNITWEKSEVTPDKPEEIIIKGTVAGYEGVVLYKITVVPVEQPK